MTRALFYSGLFHLILAGIFIVSALGEIEPEAVSETVRIRLRGRVDMAQRPRIIPSLPPESERERAGRPALPGPSSGGSVWENNLPLEAVKHFKYAEPPVVVRSGNTVSTPYFVLDALPNHFLDPLSGLESALPAEPQSPAPMPDRWAITWENGGERGIVKNPSIDRDAFPAVTERLVDVMVMIEVSPRGEVISAVIEPPGSGDVRIDRYISGKALDFAFEKTLDDDGTQIGYFRLVFEGGAG